MMCLVQDCNARVPYWPPLIFKPVESLIALSAHEQEQEGTMQRLQAQTHRTEAAPAPVLTKPPVETRSSAQTLAQVIDARRFGRPMNKRAEFRHGHFMNNALVRTAGGEA